MIRERSLPQSQGGGTTALRFRVASVPDSVRGAGALPARRSAEMLTGSEPQDTD
jgi:hypothetical protein